MKQINIYWYSAPTLKAYSLQLKMLIGELGDLDIEEVSLNLLKEHMAKQSERLKSSSLGHRIRFDGREMVIRFGAYLDDFEKDRVMGAHSMATLPIPKVIEVGETESGFFAISERVQGEKHLDELDEPELRIVLPQLFDALYELQKLDLSDNRKLDFGVRKGRSELGSRASIGVRAQRSA